jgi:SAM-dependent MidA family methyltransferase
MTPKEAKQYAISEALKYLTNEQKKKVLGFVFALPVQWNELINDSVKKLTAAQCDEVLAFMVDMPGEGKGEIYPKNGDQEKDS